MLNRRDVLNQIDELNNRVGIENRIEILPVRMTIKEYLLFTGACNIYDAENIQIDNLLPIGTYSVVKDSVNESELQNISINKEGGFRQPLIMLTDYDLYSGGDIVLISAYEYGMNADMYYEYDSFKNIIRKNVKDVYMRYIEVVSTYELDDYEIPFSDIYFFIEELNYEGLKKEFSSLKTYPEKVRVELNDIWLEFDNCIATSLSRMAQINPKIKDIYRDIMNKRGNTAESEEIKDISLERIVRSLDALSRKMDILIGKMERIETKYSSVVDVIETRTNSVIEVQEEKIDTAMDNVKKSDDEFDENNPVFTMAEKVYNAQHSNENIAQEQRIQEIHNLAYALYSGEAEKYMDELNTKMVEGELSEYEQSVLQSVVEELADYMIENENSIDMSNDSLYDMELVNNPIAAEPEIVQFDDKFMTENKETSHMRDIGSGNLFMSWVGAQNFDVRVQRALSSIEYVFDEITRNDRTQLLVSDNNIIGLNIDGVTTMYDDGSGKNKISNLLIEVNKLFQGSVYEMPIRECYDVVKAVEREEVKAAKKSTVKR